MFYALLGAFGIGISLGLLGSGGSILAVPALVYLVGQDEKVAIAGSLGIVGAISAVGSVAYARARLVAWPSVWLFGVPGMFGTVLGANVSRLVSGSLQLALFALVMMLAAVFMLRGPTQAPTSGVARRAPWKIAVEGLTVGAITGLVGVGGGFLIVPALVLLGGLPVHLAIGTSLTIIALKSLVGFASYGWVLSDLDLELDWSVLGVFVVMGTAGSLLAGRIGRRMSERFLSRLFGVLLVAMGTFILVNSLRTGL